MTNTEKATALVLRTTDWSETSRIATLWTREFGKVRALAKGGRRLKSNFESALDLLTVCSIVLLRKSSGSLDLLTEAQVVKRFPRLRTNLTALYAAYYLAELLSDWTEEYDPHPVLFEEALATLEDLGTSLQDSGSSGKSASSPATGPRLARFELVLLRELGYSPILETCAICEAPLKAQSLVFSAVAGGVLCSACAKTGRGGRYEYRPLSREGWEALRALAESAKAWQDPWSPAARAEVRQVLGHYVTYLLGHQPRLLPYLGS